MGCRVKPVSTAKRRGGEVIKWRRRGRKEGIQLTTCPSCVPKIKTASPLIPPFEARTRVSSPVGESEAEWMSVCMRASAVGTLATAEKERAGRKVGNGSEDSRVEGSAEREVTAVAHSRRSDPSSAVRVFDQSGDSLLTVLVGRRKQLLNLQENDSALLNDGRV